MTRRKAFTIAAILGLVLFFSGVYTSADWARLTCFPACYDLPLYVKLAKLGMSLLCTILIYIVGVDGMKDADEHRLQAAFTFSAIADTCFFFEQPLVGIGVFCVFQIILIRRNAAGVRVHLAGEARGRRLRNIVLVGLGVFALDALLMWRVFYPHLQGGFLFWAICGYSVLLSLSVWMAWIAVFLQRFPRTNAIFIGLGMTLFYCCDLTVGLGLALERGPVWLIATSLTYLFYTPALILLALSGYALGRFPVAKARLAA